MIILDTAKCDVSYHHCLPGVHYCWKKTKNYQCFEQLLSLMSHFCKRCTKTENQCFITKITIKCDILVNINVVCRFQEVSLFHERIDFFATNFMHLVEELLFCAWRKKVQCDHRDKTRQSLSLVLSEFSKITLTTEVWDYQRWYLAHTWAKHLKTPTSPSMQCDVCGW